MQDIESMRKVKLFNGLDEKQLLLIQSYMKREVVKRGDYIIREHDDGVEMYILRKGKVKITKKLTLEIEGLPNEEKTFSTLDDSDLPSFGESGLVKGSKRTANVISLTDCTLYALSQQDFDRIAEQDIHAAYVIMRNIAIRLSSILMHTDENVVKFATALSIAVSLR